MVVEIIYLIMFLAACAVLVRKDVAKKPVFYIIMFAIGAIGSIPFEYPIISMGLWNHLISPQLLGVSWFAVLMYIPFLGISYAIGKALAGRLGYKYVMYFVSGAVLGFIIDLTSVALGFYRYNFTFPFAIGGVPLGITAAEGVAVSIAILIAGWLSGIAVKLVHRK